jgi:hypothetical protein
MNSSSSSNTEQGSGGCLGQQGRWGAAAPQLPDVCGKKQRQPCVCVCVCARRCSVTGSAAETRGFLLMHGTCVQCDAASVAVQAA